MTLTRGRIVELAQLIRVAQADERLDLRQQAFAEIVHRFQDMAYGYAYALLGDPHLAEDAAQEAFITAWSELCGVREPSSFPGWFRRIIHSRCHRILRRKRGVEPLERALDLPASEADPHDQVERDLLRRSVLAAVQNLPEGERAVTTLFYIGEYSQKEVAAFLELPVTTVQKRLYQARRKLKSRLEHSIDERTLKMVQDNLQEHRPSQDEQFARTIELFGAAAVGDAERVRALLGSDPALVRERRKGQWGERTPLHVAAAEGHLAVAELLLEHGAEVNARDEGDNATPLHWSAQNGHLELCRVLIDAGAELAATDDLHERGPLGWAVALWEFRPEVAALLIERGAPVDLFAAIALDDADRVRALVSADPGALKSRMSRFEDRRTPLQFAVIKERPAMVDLLVRLGAALDDTTESGITALGLAARDRKLAAVEQLLALGAEYDLLTALVLGDTGRFGLLLEAHPASTELSLALCTAAHQGHKEAVERLLQAGADLQCSGRSDWIRGASPLTLAADGNHTEIARILVTAGADVTHRDEYPGATPLHFSAWHGNVEIAALLLDRGADPLARDGNWNADPLGWAVESRQPALLHCYFERGLPVDLSCAANLGEIDLVRALLDRDPASIDLPSGHGTALHEAARYGHLDIVRLLLERGADPGTPNPNGETALSLVRKALQGRQHPGPQPAHPEIEALLLQHRIALAAVRNDVT